MLKLICLLTLEADFCYITLNFTTSTICNNAVLYYTITSKVDKLKWLKSIKEQKKWRKWYKVLTCNV